MLAPPAGRAQESMRQSGAKLFSIAGEKRPIMYQASPANSESFILVSYRPSSVNGIEGKTWLNYLKSLKLNLQLRTRTDYLGMRDCLN
jgi:hypothetical protein